MLVPAQKRNGSLLRSIAEEFVSVQQNAAAGRLIDDCPPSALIGQNGRIE